ILLHLVDATGDDPVVAYRTVRKELKAYDPLLAEKPEIVAFNKIDAVAADDLSAKLAEFKRRVRKSPILISGATGEGVDAAMKALLKTIRAGRTHAVEGVDAVEGEWGPSVSFM